MRGSILGFTLACVLLTVARPARAASRYVSPGGDDAHDGSLAHPYRTIAACAAVARPGDTCYLAPGTYAEWVTPPSGAKGNPISFEAQDPAHPPILAGTVAVSGFTLWQGSIWKAQVSGSVSAVFVDRQRMILAREPNLDSGDAYRPTWYQATGDGGTNSIIDAKHLTQPAGATATTTPRW